MAQRPSRRKQIRTAALALALAALACRTTFEGNQAASEIAALRVTRDNLSTEVAILETEATSLSSVTTTSSPAAAARRSPTPLPTATVAPTHVPPPPTPVLPRLSVKLLGCTTGLDFAHGLGEVTNAFVEVRNDGPAAETNVCLRLDASDAGEAHPDRRRCVSLLPAASLVRIKLTADTEYRAETQVTVHLVSDQGASAQISSANCEALDLPLRREIEETLDIVEPLPSS